MTNSVRFLFLLLCSITSLVSAAADTQSVPAALLAGVYQDHIDPRPYWISEKLDGTRAIWDGKQLRFRSGNPVNAPAWFIAGLPPRALDGELWMGRGSFDKLSAAVRRQEPNDEEWRDVRYMIFELPDATGSFTDRIAAMHDIVLHTKTPWLQMVEQFRVNDRAELKRKLNEVLKAGGEGLMLHRADAAYITGRNDALLKYKQWLDAEATVVEHLPGKGRHSGRLGALRVELPDGRRFSIGTGFSDKQRETPPPLGARVTYRYRELTSKGLPRFASFVRVREEF